MLLITIKKNVVETKDDEIIDNLHNRYIDCKYKILINNIFTNGLKDRDLDLTNFNCWMGLKNISNRYLKEKDIDVYVISFNLNN